MPAAQPQWIGYWEQPGFGRQAMQNLDLQFQDGQIKGRGIDIVGPFTFSGKYDSNGAVAMIKQYLGQHQVLYRGWYDGEGSLAGEWSIENFRGPFQMKMVRTGASEHEIQTLQ